MADKKRRHVADDNNDDDDNDDDDDDDDDDDSVRPHTSTPTEAMQGEHDRLYYNLMSNVQYI